MRSILSVLLLLILAAPALATDGVLEISQTCALETGCFPGDSAGLPVSINAAASYVLTSNLTASDPDSNAVGLLVNDIALDLNGHAIRGPAAGVGGSGVHAENRYNITVRNGRIWGFGLAGINFKHTFGDPSDGASGHRIEDMHVANNGFGAGGGGIILSGGLVVDSTVHGNRTGIVASRSTITGCTANKNEFNGFEVFSSTVSKSTAYDKFWGFLVSASQLSPCTANENRSSGIVATSSTVDGCRANGNTGNGISASAGSFVHHSSASGNTGIQIDCPNNGSDNICVDNATF
ncbi:MAG: hypothetical protein JRG86_04165 [Deltaproteobacteria bacterium]|jgi:hypothetical protein|nr:hypothetical protein [Deltaproteobacteria bacterium]